MRRLAIASLTAALCAGTASADTLREALISTYRTNPTITGQRWRSTTPITGPYQRMSAMGKESGGGSELELFPDDIEVSVEVDARFTAG